MSYQRTGNYCIEWDQNQGKNKIVDDRKMFKKCDLRDQIQRTPIVVDGDVLAIGEALWNFDCIVCVCVAI